MLYNKTLSQPCLKCGLPVTISTQRPQPPQRHYRLLFTCTNPECCLCMRTFEAISYTPAEVERYCRVNQLRTQPKG